MTKILRLRHSDWHYSKCDMVHFSIIFFFFCELCLCQEITNIQDIQTLSELPLEKLLSLKKVFQHEETQVGSSEAIENNSSEGYPEALALQNQVPIRDRGGSYQYHYEEEYHPKQEKNKIQSIFQISITALAFLAFGGYLLCLLIHAINGKQNYYDNQSATAAQNVATILATRLQQQQKKKKKNFRPRIRKRPNGYVDDKNNFSRYKRDGQHNRTRRDVFDNDLSDKMYDALLNLAEGFTNYHTIDYMNLNHSFTYNIEEIRSP